MLQSALVARSGAPGCVGSPASRTGRVMGERGCIERGVLVADLLDVLVKRREGPPRSPDLQRPCMEFIFSPLRVVSRCQVLNS